MGKRATPKLVRWRSLGRKEREDVKRKARADVESSRRKRSYKPPSGDEWAEIVKRVSGVVLAARTARRVFGAKADIVRKWRQSRANMKSRRAARYLRGCAEREVAPGTLSGVDGRLWP